MAVIVDCSYSCYLISTLSANTHSECLISQELKKFQRASYTLVANLQFHHPEYSLTQRDKTVGKDEGNLRR